jgi:hypothetical protein
MYRLYEPTDHIYSIRSVAVPPLISDDIELYGLLRIIGGTPLEIVVSTAFVLNLILTCSSAVATMIIALNNVSKHVVCMVAFIAIPITVSRLLCIPRRMPFFAHFGSEFTQT